jgi:hypothetical protein
MKIKGDTFAKEERRALPYAIEFVKFVAVFSCLVAVALVALSVVSAA